MIRALICKASQISVFYGLHFGEKKVQEYSIMVLKVCFVVSCLVVSDILSCFLTVLLSCLFVMFLFIKILYAGHNKNKSCTFYTSGRLVQFLRPPVNFALSTNTRLQVSKVGTSATTRKKYYLYIIIIFLENYGFATCKIFLVM